jgi:hypothetical protein
MIPRNGHAHGPDKAPEPGKALVPDNLTGCHSISPARTLRIVSEDHTLARQLSQSGIDLGAAGAGEAQFLIEPAETPSSHATSAMVHPLARSSRASFRTSSG